MTNARMNYNVPSMSIENFYRCLGQAIEAKRSITSHYRDIGISNGLFFENQIVISIEGDNTRVEEAVKEYVTLAGVPDFVESGSDYHLMERVLQEHGKTLKRKFLGIFVGKHVVSKTKSLESVLAR